MRFEAVSYENRYPKVNLKTWILLYTFELQNGFFWAQRLHVLYVQLYVFYSFRQ